MRESEKQREIDREVKRRKTGRKNRERVWKRASTFQESVMCYIYE